MAPGGSLRIRQLPGHYLVQDPAKRLARKCKTRDEDILYGPPIDPPVVVEVNYQDNDPNRFWVADPNMALFAELYRVDESGLTLMECIGSMVSSINAVDVPLLDKAEPHPSGRSSLNAPKIPGLEKDERRRGIFAFPKIRPQFEVAGTYRFHFALVNMRRQPSRDSFVVNLNGVWSQDINVEFTVKPPPTQSSPPLIKELAAGGIKMKLRNGRTHLLKKPKQNWSTHPLTQVQEPRPEALYHHIRNDFQEASAINACGDDIGARLVMQHKPLGSLAPPAHQMWQPAEPPMQQPLYGYGAMPPMPPMPPMQPMMQQPFYASFSSMVADDFGFGFQAADISQRTPMTTGLSSIDQKFPPAIAGYQATAFDQPMSMAPAFDHRMPMAPMAPQVSSANNHFLLPDVEYQDDNWFFRGNGNGNGHDDYHGGN